MNAVLRLVAEHLERAADPAAGRSVNETRAAELTLALQGRDDLLRDLLPDEDDALALTPVAWAWLLPLLAQASLRPADTILDAIFDRSTSPFVRWRVMEAASATSDGESDSWLLRRVRVFAADKTLDLEAVVFGQLLVQLGDEPARQAFRALLEAVPDDVRRTLVQLLPREAPAYDDWMGRREQF